MSAAHPPKGGDVDGDDANQATPDDEHNNQELNPARLDAADFASLHSRVSAQRANDAAEAEQAELRARCERVFTILFNPRTENEGIYSIAVDEIDPEAVDDDGARRSRAAAAHDDDAAQSHDGGQPPPGMRRMNIVLGFEEREDAAVYARVLRAHDLFAPEVSEIETDELVRFCDESADAGVRLQLVPRGTQLTPPKITLDEVCVRMERRVMRRRRAGQRSERDANRAPSRGRRRAPSVASRRVCRSVTRLPHDAHAQLVADSRPPAAPPASQLDIDATDEENIYGRGPAADARRAQEAEERRVAERLDAADQRRRGWGSDDSEPAQDNKWPSAHPVHDDGRRPVRQPSVTMAVRRRAPSASADDSAVEVAPRRRRPVRMPSTVRRLRRSARDVVDDDDAPAAGESGTGYVRRRPRSFEVPPVIQSSARWSAPRYSVDNDDDDVQRRSEDEDDELYDDDDDDDDYEIYYDDDSSAQLSDSATDDLSPRAGEVGFNFAADDGDLAGGGGGTTFFEDDRGDDANDANDANDAVDDPIAGGEGAGDADGDEFSDDEMAAVRARLNKLMGSDGGGDAPKQ